MTEKVKAFLFNYMPIAIRVGHEFNMNPSVILAQAALEGAFGTSFSVQNRKNHFGITAFGKTNAYWDGF
jgi:peptidoglycan hydrolase FlgJ